MHAHDGVALERARYRVAAVVEEASRRLGFDARELVRHHRGPREPLELNKGQVMALLGMLRHGDIRGELDASAVAALAWLDEYDQEQLLRCFRGAGEMSRGRDWRAQTNASFNTIESTH